MIHLKNLSYFELTKEAEDFGIDYRDYDSRTLLEQAIADRLDAMDSLDDW